jgi:hypothetical protein
MGAVGGLLFSVVTPLNNLLRHEAVVWTEAVVGSLFTFCFFGLIGVFTDKIGGEVGDA